jgi:hypothetical protein
MGWSVFDDIVAKQLFYLYGNWGETLIFLKR